MAINRISRWLKVESSLFESGAEAGLSDKLIMNIAGIFAWDVDFALEVRQNDSFSLVYEEVWQDGEKLRDGNILAAEFVNQGETSQAYSTVNLVRATDGPAVQGGSGVGTWVAHVFNVGSTGVVGTIEFEPGLQRDLPAILDRLIPPSRDYGHERTWHDGNGHSHLQATWLGPAITVPVADGRPVLGTWQQIIFVDFDNRSRRREVIVQLTGKKE